MNLSGKRNLHNIILLHKMTHDFSPPYLQSLVPQRSENITISRAKLIHTTSLLSSTVRAYNKFSINTIASVNFAREMSLLVFFNIYH